MWECPECGCKFELVKLENTNYENIIELYNESCKSLPKVERMTDARRKHIKARTKDLMKSKDDWVNLWNKVNASDFLSGRSTNWRANFDWFVESPTNMTKVLEGNYDNREDGGRKVVSFTPSQPQRPPLPSVQEWYKEAKESQAKISRSGTDIRAITQKIGREIS